MATRMDLLRDDVDDRIYEAIMEMDEDPGPFPNDPDTVNPRPDRIPAAEAAELRAAHEAVETAHHVLGQARDNAVRAEGIREYLILRTRARYGLTDADVVDAESGAISRAAATGA